MNQPTDVIIKRYCSSGRHYVFDDGNGKLFPINKNGQSCRWKCSLCCQNTKQPSDLRKQKPKAKPERKSYSRYDMEITDPQEDLEFVKRMFGN